MIRTTITVNGTDYAVQDLIQSDFAPLQAESVDAIKASIADYNTIMGVLQPNVNLQIRYMRMDAHCSHIEINGTVLPASMLSAVLYWNEDYYTEYKLAEDDMTYIERLPVHNYPDAIIKKIDDYCNNPYINPSPIIANGMHPTIIKEHDHYNLHNHYDYFTVNLSDKHYEVF